MVGVVGARQTKLEVAEVPGVEGLIEDLSDSGQEVVETSDGGLWSERAAGGDEKQCCVDGAEIDALLEELIDEIPIGLSDVPGGVGMSPVEIEDGGVESLAIG